MGKIGGTNYTLESMRRLTVSALCQGKSPSVVTAMTKYHMTEMGREVIEHDDIHAGKGIQLGAHNYLKYNYMATPVSITVEGANILTRNLMIFGRGQHAATVRLEEMKAASNPDEEQGLLAFDGLLMKHVGFAVSNVFGNLWMGLTSSRFNETPVSGETGRYYQHLTRFSRGLAMAADVDVNARWYET